MSLYYIYMPSSMQYITLLLSSTPPPSATTSPLKVRVEYSCGSVEYTTTCSTGYEPRLCPLLVRATLPPSILFADRALLHRGYSISVPKAWGETVSKPLGLKLGLVYNPSRLQLTRRSLHSIAKQEWHGQICWPWWALQAIKRRVRCRSAVWIRCIWVGREWRGGCWRFSL